MEKDFFHFKGFKLRNRDSKLKINTDGVLLAAWCSLDPHQRILDIGTAGGVIPHVLAYRQKDLVIDGIDIDKKAILEAQYNAELNKLGSMNFYNLSLQEYVGSVQTKYDQIISNPPFFTDKQHYNTAKHDSTLSLEELIMASLTLMKPESKLSVIIPTEKESHLDRLAKQNGLYKTRLMQVRGKKNGPKIRSLIEYSEVNRMGLDIEEIHIRDGQSKDGFSKEYQNLTKDLYLNF